MNLYKTNITRRLGHDKVKAYIGMNPLNIGFWYDLLCLTS